MDVPPFKPTAPVQDGNKKNEGPMTVMTTRVPQSLRRRLWVFFRESEITEYRSLSRVVQHAVEEFLGRRGA